MGAACLGQASGGRPFLDQVEGSSIISKEGDLLFPILIEKGVLVHGYPRGVSTAEHVGGRTLAKGMAEATDVFERDAASAREVLAGTRRRTAKLCPGRIRNEDSSLFPMTDKVPRPEELLALNQKFEEVEGGNGRDIRDRFMQWAEQLEQRLW